MHRAIYGRKVAECRVLSLGIACLLLILLVSPNQAHAAAPTGPAVETPPKAPAWLEGFRVRFPLRVVGDPAANPTSQTITARLPASGWLKPDGADVAVQAASGQVIPVAVLSHDPAGDTLIQFKRSGNDRWYWAYAGNDKPPARANPAQEGITLEVREWAGDDLSSWPAVLAGLKKSDKVIGNGLVANVIQNCNPARPDAPNRFTASYRGYLDIKKAGVYRFFVNCDDAAFLFIDGFKVCERTGSNQRMAGYIPIKSIGVDVELKAGVHPFEVHHVAGTTSGLLGYCTLIWMPPEAKGWAFVPYSDFVHPLYAEVTGVEAAGSAPVAVFSFGIDDTLFTNGTPLFLTRFEAHGQVKDQQQLQWDFGDGTTGTGRSVTHVYFKGGPYTVTLRCGAGPMPFRRTVHVWAAPAPTSPFSLPAMVKALGECDWKRFEPARVRQMFEFLLACEQPGRWPLLESVARHLLAGQDADPGQRAGLYIALMEALAEQGRAGEALKLVEPALQEFARVPTLQVGIKLAAADLHGKYLKEPTEAGKLYEQITQDYRRLEHPSVRLAAVHWGDLHAEAGDLTRAAEVYRLAASLGGDRFRTTAQSAAVTRGAMLRMVEQKLRAGDIRQGRQLLDRIVLEHPEQKLEGLYRFLQAESDRQAGRYEQAIRNYEFLVKLTQWAGYRDRALHGIADSYARMPDHEKALHWLAALKESSPRYFEKQKLADQQRNIEAQLARLEAARKEGKTAPAEFEGFYTGFEPGEKLPGEPVPLVTVLPGLGMAGSHISQLEMGWPRTRGAGVGYQLPLPNIRSKGTYWVEFWYRDAYMCSWLGHLIVPQLQANLYGKENDYNPEGGGLSLYAERTHGQWRKFAFTIKAPVAENGRLLMLMQYGAGMLEIDGLSVRPLTDRQNDLLQSFIEGTDNP